MQVLGGLLQDDALGAALALNAGDEGGEAVERVADGLAALLLYLGGAAGLDGLGAGD